MIQPSSTSPVQITKTTTRPTKLTSDEVATAIPLRRFVHFPDLKRSISTILLKFAPKIPVRKQAKPVIVKRELQASKDDTVDKELLAKLNNAKYQDDFGKKFKTEMKGNGIYPLEFISLPTRNRGAGCLLRLLCMSRGRGRCVGQNRAFLGIPAQVTFGYGNTSTQARSFGTHKAEPKYDEDDSNQAQIKEYVEPFDYIRTYYPVTLPSRRPYSGNPEVLDKLEFGEGGSAHLPVNENQVNAAHELGFMEMCDEPKMIFLQFPTRLPLALSNLKLEEGGESKTGTVPSGDQKGRKSTGGNASKTAFCKLKDLPAGFMGKLLVYRSGKVKMKSTRGVDHKCAEEVVAVNVKERRYCVLGELSKHAVVVPDIDSMLKDLDNLNAHN
ncbi:hypothetical protein KSP40_PGU015358 [Platanthera guangdongensis]|uniref:DNA-directed RNA polymerase III subunit RPC4 n=1 Tax=Platanthera guangdongensis TaxID=2320717 RepID=A0ABR2M475_9ASPA